MHKKIKILRIITRLNIGGPAIHTVLLTSELSKDYFESVLVIGKVDKTEGDMSYLARNKGISPIIIPQLQRKVHILNDLITLIKIYNIINHYRPDIVHTHTAKAGAAGRLAAFIYRLIHFRKSQKIIHTFHGHVLEGYFDRIRTKIFICIERILAGITDKIIVVSQSLKDNLVELRIANPEKIEVMPLGLELEKFMGIVSSRESNHVLNVGIVGRLVSIKNHRMFLDAAKKIKEDFIDSRNETKNKKIKFFIIGDGELRGPLEDYALKLGLKGFIEFTGWQMDLEKVYSSLDIICITSLNEGTPVSLIEAMAAARPIIATKVGGVQDLLKPLCQIIGLPDERILIKPNDINSFARGIIFLLDNQDLRFIMGQAGRAYVKERFTKERLIKDMVGLYNNILNRR